MAGAIIAPVDTFRGIAEKPTFAVALIIIVVLSLASTLIVTPHIDLDASLRPQFMKQGMKQEDADRAIDMAEKIKKFSAPINVVAYPVIFLIVAAVPFIIFKVFGAAGTYLQFLAVTVYAWIPEMLKGIIMTVLVALKGKLTIEEMSMLLRSNPGSLVSMSDSPIAFAALSAIDFFELWTLVLLIIGFAFAARVSRTRSAAVMITLWVIFTLGRLGIAALQTMGGAR
jgi:Yip1 domain.